MLGRPLMVHTLHDTEGILNSKRNLWLTDSRLPKYQGFLPRPESSCLSEEGKGGSPASGEVFMESYTSHPDLSDQPSENTDLVLYTDGES